MRRHQDADVPVQHYQGEGLIHGYFGLGEASDVARARRNAPEPISSHCLNEDRKKNRVSWYSKLVFTNEIERPSLISSRFQLQCKR